MLVGMFTKNFPLFSVSCNSLFFVVQFDFRMILSLSFFVIYNFSAFLLWWMVRSVERWTMFNVCYYAFYSLYISFHLVVPLNVFPTFIPNASCTPPSRAEKKFPTIIKCFPFKWRNWMNSIFYIIFNEFCLQYYMRYL